MVGRHWQCFLQCFLGPSQIQARRCGNTSYSCLITSSIEIHVRFVVKQVTAYKI